MWLAQPIDGKRRLNRVMTSVESSAPRRSHGRMRQEVVRACVCWDLRGVVGKWKFGSYRSDGTQTSWVKVKNATYSQAEGRGELFHSGMAALVRRRVGSAGWS